MPESIVNSCRFACTSVTEAHARLADAHSALTGLCGLLRQADDLHEISGANLAALLCGPLGEVAAAKDELRSAAAGKAATPA